MYFCLFLLIVVLLIFIATMFVVFFFFQAEDGIRDWSVTGVQTCALPISVPDLGSIESNALMWPGFEPHWPSAGPAFEGQFTPMGAWGIPAINTLLLLSSGVTVTLAHYALKENNRKQVIAFLALTVALGVLFLALQVDEYGHAIRELNLKLSTGVYGSTFFMLTGFHGFHVTCGAIMLTVILVRCIRGHFTPDHHFGFEGVAWYWHFVDVVWLGLFIFVYWL